MEELFQIHTKKERKRTLIKDSVNVGGHIYEVEVSPETLLNDGKCGRCDLANKKIAVSSSQSVSKQEETFAHEILHAMFFESGAADVFEAKGLKNEDFEMLVVLLQGTFWRFLKENTNFFEEKK